MSDLQQELRAELRKLSAWAAFQRKMTRCLLLVVAVCLPTLLVVVVLVRRPPARQTAGEVSWAAFYRAANQDELREAIRIGERLLQKADGHPTAHLKVAYLHVATGNLERSLVHFQEAYRLCPSEENARNLEAVRRRVQGTGSAARGSL
jgi:hypothetical protein